MARVKVHRMAPKPSVMEEELLRVIGLALLITRDYEEVYDLGHSPGGTPQAGEPTRGGGIAFSDATSSVVVSTAKEYARSNAAQAAEKVMDAIGKLREARLLIEHAYPRDRNTYETTVPPYLTVVTRKDIDEAKAAQLKRLERGEQP